MEKVTRKQAYELIDFVKANKNVNKYLYKYSWISGSSTEVYPIALWRDDLTLQIDTNRNFFEKLIEEVKNKFDFISCAYFEKSDGSCPSRLVFKFKFIGEWF